LIYVVSCILFLGACAKKKKNKKDDNQDGEKTEQYPYVLLTRTIN